MKLFTLMILILGCFLSAPLFAQGDADFSKIREAMQKEKDTIITSDMNLTESEGKSFWPLYREYQEALNKIQDRSFKLIAGYAQEREKETFSDEKAKALIEEYLDIEREKLWLKKAYSEKFSKILPPKKVMRYFQLENKVAAMTDCQITQQVPLAK
jgi:hypothetical protein